MGYDQYEGVLKLPPLRPGNKNIDADLNESSTASEHFGSSWHHQQKACIYFPPPLRKSRFLLMLLRSTGFNNFRPCVQTLDVLFHSLLRDL